MNDEQGNKAIPFVYNNRIKPGIVLHEIMKYKLSELAKRVRRQYSEEGFLSLVAEGLHFLGNTVYHNDGCEFGKITFPFPASNSNIQLHASGLGDLMIVRQFGRAVQDYYREFGDPELGDIVIATGGLDPAFNPDPGDVNLYWWWSFGRWDSRPDQYLEYYLDKTTVKPDAILCLSNRCVNEAEQLGYDTLLLPLGNYAFEPLQFERRGLGYAGSRSHKDSDKVARLLEPYKDTKDFEWVSHFVYPEQLNLWYNQKLVTFGLHKEGQRQWGMLNNRVFETLASGTPFILEGHPNVQDILGFDFPYQSGSTEETIELVESIRNNPQKTVSEFRKYSDYVQENHSYYNRVKKLCEFIS